jgi:hypothetical protein
MGDRRRRLRRARHHRSDLGQRLSYDEHLAPRAIVDDVGGIRLRVAALSDIIVASKETADRAKDREAFPGLRRLVAQRLPPGAAPAPANDRQAEAGRFER